MSSQVVLITGALEPLVPPPEPSLRRYAVQMLGVYPARGCPYRCSFCSVIKIAGHRIRSQPLETTLASLRAAKAAGVLLVMFTCYLDVHCVRRQIDFTRPRNRAMESVSR